MVRRRKQSLAGAQFHLILRFYDNRIDNDSTLLLFSN